MKTSPAGIELIKEFEGLELKAYPDPGSGGEPYTIGYGHTGGVKPGQVITAERAEELLVKDLAGFERDVDALVKVPLTQAEFDALVSFTFNVGTGALSESTLLRRLNKGEPRCTVYYEELPRWVNGANGPMPGLVSRRNAEADMACNGAFVKEVDKTEQVEGFLAKAATHYTAETHQEAAWAWLEGLLGKDTLEEFKARYRGSQPPAPEVPPIVAKFPLDVPYFYQRDSKTGHGERMCFSSSMAMAIEYLDPEAFDGDDDVYLRQVLRYGDTVSSEAQLEAARNLGMQVNFRTDCREQDIINQLDEGIPVPIGILHKGPVNSPSGGGHWICVIGYDQSHFMVHDPFGELDLVSGGYPKAGPHDGMNQRYSRENLMKRWLIANDHDGWAMMFD